MAYEFYYDRVLSNPYLTYRVIGQKFITDGNGRVTEDSFNNDEVANKLSDPATILKGAIRRPTQVSITHGYSYSGNSLTSIVENFKNWMATVGVTIAQTGQTFNDLLDTISGDFTGTPQSSVLRGLQKLAPSDFYKVFTGTDVEIPLNFEARLYSIIGEGGKIIPPYERLKTVNEYFMGSEVGLKQDSSIYMYTSPHGYSGIKGQNWNPTGVLTIYIGRFIELRNLVLTNYSINASRELLYLDNKVRGPLYIDVNFSCIPAVIYTSKDINRMVSGDFVNDNTRYEDTRELESATLRGKRDEVY